MEALCFYLITNTLSWWFNPFEEEGYTRDMTGWLLALTKGTGGFPPTWMFLRNTLASGALFTGLFVGAAKWAEATQESAEQAETDVESETDSHPVPEESEEVPA